MRQRRMWVHCGSHRSLAHWVRTRPAHPARGVLAGAEPWVEALHGPTSQCWEPVQKFWLPLGSRSIQGRVEGKLQLGSESGGQPRPAQPGCMRWPKKPTVACKGK